MKFLPTEVKDCTLIEMDRHFDERGFFQELYQESNYHQGLDLFKSDLPLGDYCATLHWEQLNWSYSKKNVLRGLHAAPYVKLVTCVSGRVWDVIVDLRSKSPTFSKWFATELSPDKPTQIMIPPNCGHGFVALEDNSTLIYMTTGMYAKEGELTVAYNEPNFNIPWPGENHIISKRDREGASLWEYFCCAELDTNWQIYDQVQKVWLDSLTPERRESFLINTGKIKPERTPQTEFPSFLVEI